MENKAHALLAGIFTIVLLIAAILVGMWFNRDRVVRVPYEIATKLSVPGLNPQADVRYRGLDVGKVDEISFDPEVPGQILIHLSVNPDTPITKSTYGTLGYQGVTGIAYIQLDDDGSNPVRVGSSEQQTARIDMHPSLFDNLQTRGLEILVQTEELTKRLNIMLEPANQKMVLAAFDNVSKAAIAIEKIPAQLAPTLAQLPDVAKQAQHALQTLDAASHEFKSLATMMRVEGGAVDKFNRAADQVNAAAAKLELATTPLATDARTTLRTLNRTLETVGQQPQSLLFGTRKRQPGPGEAGFVAPEN